MLDGVGGEDSLCERGRPSSDGDRASALAPRVDADVDNRLLAQICEGESAPSQGGEKDALSPSPGSRRDGGGDTTLAASPKIDSGAPEPVLEPLIKIIKLLKYSVIATRIYG